MREARAYLGAPAFRFPPPISRPWRFYCILPNSCLRSSRPDLCYIGEARPKERRRALALGPKVAPASFSGFGDNPGLSDRAPNFAVVAESHVCMSQVLLRLKQWPRAEVMAPWTCQKVPLNASAPLCPTDMWPWQLLFQWGVRFSLSSCAPCLALQNHCNKRGRGWFRFGTERPCAVKPGAHSSTSTSATAKSQDRKKGPMGEVLSCDKDAGCPRGVTCWVCVFCGVALCHLAPSLAA